MTDEPQTVAEAWGMCCPSCGKDDTLVISATVSVRLRPDGTDDENSGGHEWDDDSTCTCGAVDGCGVHGKVKDFELPAPKHPHWNPDSVWLDHSEYPPWTWIAAVRADSTRLSYVEWVNAQIEAE